MRAACDRWLDGLGSGLGCYCNSQAAAAIQAHHTAHSQVRRRCPVQPQLEPNRCAAPRPWKSMLECPLHQWSAAACAAQWTVQDRDAGNRASGSRQAGWVQQVAAAQCAYAGRLPATQRNACWRQPTSHLPTAGRSPCPAHQGVYDWHLLPEDVHRLQLLGVKLTGFGHLCLRSSRAKAGQLSQREQVGSSAMLRVGTHRCGEGCLRFVRKTAAEKRRRLTPLPLPPPPPSAAP